MEPKRRWFLLALLLAALVAGAWLMVRHPTYPVYQGRPLDQWVDYCSSNAITIPMRSDQYGMYFYSQLPHDVRHFGPSAVPGLMRMLGERHPFEARLQGFVSSRNLHSKWQTNFLRQANLDLMRPETAAYFLGCLGPDADPAIPALMRAAVDTNYYLSANAFRALGAIHGRPEQTVPSLIGLANGPNLLFRAYALEALCGYTQCPRMVMPTLVKTLEQSPPSDSAVAVIAGRLRFFGTNATAAVPALYNIANDANASLDVRSSAAESLRWIAPNSYDYVRASVYIDALRNYGAGGPYDAILGLYEMGPRARVALPALQHFITLPVPEASEAAYALKAIDPAAAAEIWPQLLRDSQDLSARYHRRDPVGSSDAMKDWTLAKLIGVFTNDDKSAVARLERDHAAHWLGEMGPSARDAIPALVAVTNAFPTALAALMKIRGEPVSALIEQLRNQSDDWDWTATADAIGEFGTNAAAAVPLLVDGIAGPPEDLRKTSIALRSLGEIHSRPDLSLPALTRYLDYPGASLRRTALDALGEFGSDARPALPQIVVSLQDLDQFARIAATNALKKIDPATAAQAGVK